MADFTVKSDLTDCSTTFAWGLRLTARARTFSDENVLCSSGLLRPHANVGCRQTLYEKSARNSKRRKRLDHPWSRLVIVPYRFKK